MFGWWGFWLISVGRPEKTMQGDEVNLQPSCVMQFTDVPDLFLRIIVTLEDTWHAEFVGRTMMAMVFRERESTISVNCCLHEALSNSNRPLAHWTLKFKV